MNATILAERTAKATTAVEAETRRLGGQLTIPSTRGDAAHRHLFMLEAVAAALAGIGAGGEVEASTVTEAPPASTSRKPRK